MKLTFLNPVKLQQTELSFPDKETIHICIFHLDDYSLLSQEIKSLPNTEQKKAASFRQEKDRIRYLLSRALLRTILSSYLHCPAKDLLFGTGLHGKPYLINWGRGNFKNTPSPINFNLSHSGDYIALAFSTVSPIGIDIEKVRPNIHMESLVRRFFHPDEYASFSCLTEEKQRDFLFRRWTVREAFLKGTGSGLTLDPRSFCVVLKYTIGDTKIYHITKSQEDFSSWQIASIPAPDNYFCSVAYYQI